MKGLLRFTGAAVAVTAAVVAVGMLGTGPWAARGLIAGSLIGLTYQVVMVGWVLPATFPHSPLIGFALGTVGRVLLLGVVAFAAVPGLGLPAAPTLLAMVAVLFLTSVTEPLMLRPKPQLSR